MKSEEELRNEPDYAYESARILHWFPAAAAIVGGDPEDLWSERFWSLVNAIPDIENWKHGESGDKRANRVFMERLEGLVR